MDPKKWYVLLNVYNQIRAKILVFGDNYKSKIISFRLNKKYETDFFSKIRFVKFLLPTLENY